MSQGVLADRVGLTFQQIQKYERGTNRVSASMLYEIAKALDAPLAAFFDGLAPTDGDADDPISTASLDALHRLTETRGGQSVAELFPKIRAPRLRSTIADLVRALAIDERAMLRWRDALLFCPMTLVIAGAWAETVIDAPWTDVIWVGVSPFSAAAIVSYLLLERRRVVKNIVHVSDRTAKTAISK